MTPTEPSPEVARLQAAVAALEDEQWRDGASLLISQLDDLVDRGLHAHEATTRALLAQAMHQLGQERVEHLPPAREPERDREVDHRDVGRDGQPAVGDHHPVGVPQPAHTAEELGVQQSGALHGSRSASRG